MKDVVFTSYAFGELYVMQQKRLEDSIRNIYPEANIRSWSSVSGSSDNNRDELPPGSPTFAESMYGFKVHCVKNCLAEGFKKIIFLDAAMILEGKIDKVMDKAAEVGVLAAIDRAVLSQVISDQCLRYIGKTDKDLEGLTIVGGSLYIFDFNNPKCVDIFNYWAELEAEGMFGKEDDCSRGILGAHRKDETCMSLALNKYGSKPYGFDEVGYHNIGDKREDAPMFTFCKLHFKGIGVVHDHKLNQSLLHPHSNILDLGCRDFKFTEFFREFEHNVYPVDIGTSPGEYHRIAVSDKDGYCGVQKERDPDATHICKGDNMPMMTLDTLSKFLMVKHWHLIKMDIEGEELNILKTATHPIADQVTVEFHAHVKELGHTKKVIDEVLDMLEEFYYIENRLWEDKHSAGFNYWSVLLIAK